MSDNCGFIGAWTEIGALENLAQNKKKVGGGPMVTFQHGPELYDDVVQRLSGPWPRFRRWRRRKLVIDVPFRRFLQLQGGVGHVS